MVTTEQARNRLEAATHSVWTAQLDDLIGGWCVTVGTEPPSQGNPAVGRLLSKDSAEHIAALHNAWLRTVLLADDDGDDD